MSLSLQGIRKSYGSNLVLEDINLDVEQGELMVLLGPSGCGKTTTLDIISGIERQDSGDIYFSGQLINDVPPEKRPIGLVFQDYALFPHLTVHGNVAFGLEARGKTSDTEQKVAKMLGFLGIESLNDRYPKSLSGGEQQRVALARALILEPELLLLDEPLSDLDARLRENLRFELKRLHKTLGITTLYVTHDHTEAITIGDRVAILHDKRIEQVGQPEEIFFRPKTDFVASFVGAENRFKGHVSEIDTERNLVRILSDDLEIAVSLDEEVSVGEHVCVFVRPDDVNVALETPLAATQNVFKGRIKDTHLTGSFVRMNVMVKDRGLITVTPRQVASDLDLNPGKEVFVMFKPTAVKCIRRPFCRCPAHAMK